MSKLSRYVVQSELSIYEGEVGKYQESVAAESNEVSDPFGEISNFLSWLYAEFWWGAAKNIGLIAPS